MVNVQNKIKQAQVIEKPFPHIYIENALSRDELAQLRDRFESVSWLIGNVPWHKGRECADVTDLSTMEHFWSIACTVMLWRKFGREWSGTAPLMAWTFSRTNRGYSLEPHLDTTTTHMNVIIYLSEDNPYGTSFYQPQDSNKQYSWDTVSRHYPFEEFKVVKTIPFKPGTLISWATGKDAWHGVEPIITNCTRMIANANLRW